MTQPPAGPPSTILVASDGSPAAARALPMARVIAQQLGAAVEVLYVTPETAPEMTVWERLQADLGPREQLQVRTSAESTAEALISAAAAAGVCLLVLTTHGHAAEVRQPLGSIVESVVARTTRPILLVRPETELAREAQAHPFQRLLIPLDGTPQTAVTLCPAFDLVAQLGASADVLYVATPGKAGATEQGSVSGSRYVDQPQHEWTRWTSEVLDRLCTSGARAPAQVPIQVYLATGDLGETIVEFARAHHYDAIVLARRSHLEPGRAEVIRTVLDRTPCPVLLVGANGD